MKLASSMKMLAVASLAIAAVGCGGGSGSTSTGGVFYSHDQLAKEFVQRAWGDAGLDLTLVKSNTLQHDYIVVYDHDYATYDAYDLSVYNVGDNIYDYVVDNQDWFYYDLEPIGGNQFRDPYTGVIFEETASSSKDLAKVAALKEELQVKKSADHIRATYGLSAERSREVARLAVQLAKAPAKSMTDADYDNFSKELLGASITQFKTAASKQMQGDGKQMEALIEQAAAVNGVGPEHMNKIVGELFK